MAVERAFIVKLLADNKQLLQGFNEVRVAAGNAFGGANVEAQKLVPAFGKITAAAGVAFAGLTAAAGVAIKAAVDAQAEQNRLREILLTTGGASEQQVESLIAQAEALEKVGVASAGSIITAQSQLATFDLQFETIQRLTPAITDYVIAEKGATASAEDFKSMTNALAQALQGNFGALTKSGFVLDETTKGLIKNGTEAERSAALVDVLNSTYKGFNESARETAEGRLVALRNSFDSLRENIGTALLPVFEGLIGILQRFTDFAGENTGLIIGLGVALGVFTGIIIAASLALKVYAAAAAIATAANTAFGLSLTATGIGAIVVVIGLLVGAFVTAMVKSEGFRNAVIGMLNGIIGGLENFVNVFIAAWNFVLEKIRGIGPVLRVVGIDVSNLGPVGEVSFGRIGKSADDAAAKINNVAIQADLAASRLAAANQETGLVTLAGAQNKLAAATARVNDLRAQALKGPTSIEALNQAIKDQSAAQSVLNSILGQTATTSRGAAAAQKEVKTAAQQYTEVLKKAQGASDTYERSTRRLRDAKKGLESADADLIAAQEALTRAQQAGTPGEIADAQRALAAAERNVTRGKFAGEQAAFAVKDAEKKLAEVRADGESTAQDIREAEIALAEAKLAVTDQEDQQIETARRLEEARRNLRIATEGLREGDAELIPLQVAVNRAKEAQIRATENHTDAVKDEAEALKAYRAELDALATAIINFPKVAARIGSPDLVPIVPSPVTPVPIDESMRKLPDTVVVQVESSVVNPQQVGQEIADYLRAYSLGGGDPTYYGAAIAV